MARTGSAWSGWIDTAVELEERTSDGVSEEVKYLEGAMTKLRCQLNVASVTGVTPTLNVVIQDSIDETNWNTIGTFAEKVAAGREMINITAPFCNCVRASWVIDGDSPAFVFSVTVAAIP